MKIILPQPLIIFPAIIIAFFFSILFFDVISIPFFRGEDGAIELMSAFFYLLAIIMCLLGLFLRKSNHVPFLILWLVLAIVFFGEETSWLQHVIGYQTPDQILQLNAQKEFNLHNLKWFHKGGFFDSSESKIGGGNIFSSQNLFRIGFAIYFLFFPILIYLRLDRGFLSKYRFPYPDRRLMLYIWIPIVISLILAVLSTGDIKDVIAETREMYYAACIFTYVSLIAFQSKSQT